jgi:hypothetical protein
MKTRLYEQLIARMDDAVSCGRHVEAAWYAYSVLEDRLRSMLVHTGGEGSNKGSGPPLKMLGPKLTELKTRAGKDDLLRSCLEFKRVDQWRKDRNELVHAMAAGQLDITQIDSRAAALAIEGAELARLYATEARRLKTHRDKVTLPAL